MTTLSVPPGCTGVELPSGQKIDANRQGKVMIDDPRAEKAALKSVHARNGVVARTTFGFGHVKRGTAKCTACVFTGWSWQKVCTKCGADMKIEETE